MLKIGGLFIACALLSACGGGGGSSTPGGGGGSVTTSNAWQAQLTCSSGCTTTQGTLQIQIQPSITVGTGLTAGCSFKSTASDSNQFVGLPAVANAIAYVSLVEPDCTGGGWNATITFTSVGGGSTEWTTVKTYMLNGQNVWTSISPSSSTSSLTISTSVSSQTVTSFAITN